MMLCLSSVHLEKRVKFSTSLIFTAKMDRHVPSLILAVKKMLTSILL